jgi:bifunctional non-homologous end joining protein LigD
MLIKPMLAETGSQKDLDRTDWLYEEKLDGVRCIAILGDETELQARSGSIITRKFPELLELHRQVKKPCILDGEIAGKDFNAIQHRIHVEDPFKIRVARTQFPIFYYVFDILYLDDESVKQQALLYRKEILSNTLTPGPDAKPLEWSLSGEELFAEMKGRGLEGLMAKDVAGYYDEGKRSPRWLKVKNFIERNFFICGVTEGENDRSDTFGSLVLGKMVEGKLVYVGNVGSGFRQDQLRPMLTLLSRREGECPFEVKPDIGKGVKFWTHPDIRCEVRFLDMPSMPDAKLRFPVFRKVV